MKTLKFNHDDAQRILQGLKTTTWRLYDDKDLSVDDVIKVIDKVKPNDPSSWLVIGRARVEEIVEKKLGRAGDEDMKGKGHETYASKDEMLKAYKSYYGDRVTFDTPVKIVHFAFTPTDGDAPTRGMLLDEAKIYTDGGSRGNPGDSAGAYVICSMDDSVVEKSGYYIGMATNNQAEYYGFLKGLERARDLGISKITLFSDSQLVVNQMKGVYKVKNQELAPLHQQVSEVANFFEKIDFIYVPRELNSLADGEVNRILDDSERHKKHR